MASLKAIRDAIKTTVEAAITDLHCYDTVPESPQLPALIVRPSGGDFTRAMGRGTDQWTFDLMVLVSIGDIDLAQDQLDDLITGAGSTSIRQAIFKASTLGLANTSAFVSGVTDYGIKVAAQIDHIGAAMQMVVVTTGTA